MSAGNQTTPNRRSSWRRRRTFTNVVVGASQLQATYAPPVELALRKQLKRLDEHCCEFIARSPFALLATASRTGACDVSPRGGDSGFVRVVGANQVAIPDTPGNRRLDSIRNILDNPYVGMLFLLPGMGETLRLNGPALLTQDERLLDELASHGKRPLLAIVVEPEEIFLQCAKALRRSGLWNPTTWPDAADLPSAARMFSAAAQDERLGVEAVQAELDDAYANTLY